MERQGLTYFVTQVKHGKPVSLPFLGRQTVRNVVSGAGKRLWKKRMPSCNGIDRG
ncbi:hypothetical protein C2B19_23780 [Salmonella enterica]|nr:hypothetical protein [Salmonella enterica]